MKPTYSQTMGVEGGQLVKSKYTLKRLDKSKAYFVGYDDGVCNNCYLLLSSLDDFYLVKDEEADSLSLMTREEIEGNANEFDYRLGEGSVIEFSRDRIFYTLTNKSSKLEMPENERYSTYEEAYNTALTRKKGTTYITAWADDENPTYLDRIDIKDPNSADLKNIY